MGCDREVRKGKTSRFLGKEGGSKMDTQRSSKGDRNERNSNR